jgi:hypothetical protein
MKTRGRAVLGVGLGLYLIVLGALVGAAVERIQFDRQRAQVLARYDQAVRAWHTQLMALEAQQ